MRRKARIVMSISKRGSDKRRISIPEGRCELDDGPHGAGPYVVYWNHGGQTVKAELTLMEFVSCVACEVLPSANLGQETRDRLFARDRC